jgi:hypothetical protein
VLLFDFKTCGFRIENDLTHSEILPHCQHAIDCIVGELINVFIAFMS